MESVSELDIGPASADGNCSGPESADSSSQSDSAQGHHRRISSAVMLGNRTHYSPRLVGKRSVVQKQGQLLLVSLLENFCSMYAQENGERHGAHQRLFAILCR